MIHYKDALSVLREEALKRVTKQARIAVISGWPSGSIQTSTVPYLGRVLPLFGTEVQFHQTVLDDALEFERMISQSFKDAPDIILASGVVTSGKFDWIVNSVERMGAEIVFHQVAIQPGESVFFARFGSSGPVLFGTSGDPISTAVGVRFFVNPYVRALLSMEPETPTQVTLLHDEKKPKGLRCFYKANTGMGAGRMGVDIFRGPESYGASPLLNANSWVVLAEESSCLKKGETVEVFPFLVKGCGF